MPKKIEGSLNFSQSIGYDDSDDDIDDDEDYSNDNDSELELPKTIRQSLPTLTQILMVARLLGKHEYTLSRTGTKKFFNKVRQYQELSQIDKPNDVNYGSRMGKAAEILCKLAAIVEILKISTEIIQ